MAKVGSNKLHWPSVPPLHGGGTRMSWSVTDFLISNPPGLRHQICALSPDHLSHVQTTTTNRISARQDNIVGGNRAGARVHAPQSLRLHRERSLVERRMISLHSFLVFEMKTFLLFLLLPPPSPPLLSPSSHWGPFQIPLLCHKNLYCVIPLSQ